MAEGKKSFLLHCDVLTTVEKMPDELAGKLFKLILEYVNDKNPEINDLTMHLAFEPIKQSLKRSLRSWEEKKEKRADAGRLGGLAKASNAKKSLANLAVSGSVSVSDSVFKESASLIDIFFNDLPNSTVFESIARDTGIDRNTLLAGVPEFRETCNTEYKDFGDFCSHFKRWSKKRSPDQKIKLKTSFGK